MVSKSKEGEKYTSTVKVESIFGWSQTSKQVKAK